MLRWSAAAAILLFAAALRLGGLERDSFTTDELAAVRLARAPADASAVALRSRSGATPLPAALLHVGALYGVREEPLRLPAALLGVAGVAAAMLLARDLFGARAALAGALVLAASPLHVDASRQAAAYAISATTSMILCLALWRLIAGARVTGRAALVAAVALYGGYSALAVMAASLLTALWGLAVGRVGRASMLRLLLVAVVAAALFAPWAVYDLPTEPGAQFIPKEHGLHLAERLLDAPLLASSDVGSQWQILGGALAALAIVGALAAWRRRRLAVVFSLAVIAVGVAAALISAYFAPYVFLLPQLLYVLPLYFGLAAFGFDWAILRRLNWPALRTPLILLAAVALVWVVEWPALARQRAARVDDWGGAFGVVLRNLGRDDLAAVPMSADAVALYGSELVRRMPSRDRVVGIYNWMARSDRGWLVIGWGARLNPEWPDVFRRLKELRFAVDLSPSDEPAVYFLGAERQRTYVLACHFDLPAKVIARQTILRDCLRQLGAVEGTLRQVETLLAEPSGSLRNPSLLESVALLQQNGQSDAARKLAEAIVRREADWPEARAALVSLAAASSGAQSTPPMTQPR